MTSKNKVAAALVAVGSQLRKMVQARTLLLLDEPFVGSLAVNLKLVEDLTCKTAWVDGRSLGFNPRYIETLTMDQTKGTVFHEVFHVALGHPWRRDGREPAKWNRACDKVINHLAREAGHILPPDVLYAEGDEVGKSAEWIYSHEAEGEEQPEDEPGEQPDEQEQDGQPDPDGEQKSDEEQDDEGDEGEGEGEGDQPGDSEGDGQPGEWGDGNIGEVRDAPTGPDAEGDEAPSQEDWKEKVAAAAVYAKGMGDMTAGTARAITEALKPRVDSRSLLLRFFQDRAASDYTWTRPNPRYVAHGLYLPALQSTALGEVAVMVDTSGSIDNVALGKARAMVQDVLDECNPAGVTLVFADAKVNHTQRIERGESLTWEPAGGGGTDFRPALEHIDNGETPYACCICITDLCGTFPDVPPALPVLWLSTENAYSTAPFGETVFVGE